MFITMTIIGAFLLFAGLGYTIAKISWTIFKIVGGLLFGILLGMLILAWIIF